MQAKILYWISGFLEGEGCFSGKVAEPRIMASQVQREPLERLQRYMGGSVNLRISKRPNRQDHYVYSLSGREARGMMIALFPLMSPRRQEQIRKALDQWESREPRRLKRRCRHGIPLPPLRGEATDRRTHCHECQRIRAEQARMQAADPHWSQKYCPHGHEKTPENTYIAPGSGQKDCRPCRLQRSAVYHQRSRRHVAMKRVTHCPQGHEYTPENTYIIPKSGQRVCKACNVIRSQAFRADHPGYNGHKGEKGRVRIEPSQSSLFPL